MRVLVTGAQGFIGRHLCKRLVDEGNIVLEWDLPDQDITQPYGNPRPLDAVIHLAAIAAPRECDQDPAKAFNINVQGTHNILKLAVAAGAKRFIMASSAHVYGVTPKYLPTDERAPLSVFDTYTTSKLLGEQLCELFYQNYGLSYAAIRLYNGYGPGQKAGYFIPDMVQRAKTGRIELRGHQVTKDWVYIDDLVMAYALALESNFVGPVNIGTGREVNLEVIAKRVAQAFGLELTVLESTSPPTRMCADWRRAERVLGWQPEVTLEEGLERTIQWWKNHD